MQIQNNKNNQTFKGGVAIVGELSAVPCKHVRKVAPELKSLMKNKNFDLFIKEDFERNGIVFTVQKSNHYGKKNKPISEFSLAKKLNYYSDEAANEIYLATAKSAVEYYEKMVPKQESLLGKCKNFISKIFDK